jgi:hypothetical protein
MVSLAQMCTYAALGVRFQELWAGMSAAQRKSESQRTTRVTLASLVAAAPVNLPGLPVAAMLTLLYLAASSAALRSACAHQQDSQP